jgi:hypothetical protein
VERGTEGERLQRFAREILRRNNHQIRPASEIVSLGHEMPFAIVDAAHKIRTIAQIAAIQL